MYAARGRGAGLDRPLQHTPEPRLVPVGRAVKAMVLTGLGVVHPQLSLVPMFFQTTPTQRLVAPGIDAPHLQDETWGRAFATLYAAGVTARSRLIAVPAAPCRGLTPTVAPRDRPSVQGDGHDNRGEAPAALIDPPAPKSGWTCGGHTKPGFPCCCTPSVAIPVMRAPLDRSSRSTGGRSRPPMARQAGWRTARSPVQSTAGSGRTQGAQG